MLEEIGIQSNYIVIKDKSFFCKVINITLNLICFLSPDELSDEETMFMYRVDEQYYELPIKKILHTTDYEHYYEYQIQGSFIPLVQQKLEEKITIDKTLEQRKEQRYEIGTKKSEIFSLSSAEQYFYYENKRYPCVLSNVSYHGSAITSYIIPQITTKKILNLYLSFTGPKETLIQSGLVMRIENKTKEFAVYSLQILEPKVIWKRRLAQYIQKVEQEG